MLNTALIVMVVGMSFVMTFLVIQVLVTLISAKVSGKFAYLLPEPAAKTVKKPAAASADESEVVAAIVMALKKN